MIALLIAAALGAPSGSPQTMKMPMPAPLPSPSPQSGMTMPMSRAKALSPKPTIPQGPPRAADAIWGAGAMKASRAELKREMGAQTLGWFSIDRLEYHAQDGRDGYQWEAQGYYGGDIDKLWVKTEGESAFGEAPEQAEAQALWSHAIGPWFDLQAGVRQEFVDHGRTDAVVGVQGLAPYDFDVDGALFLSTHGELRARGEAELDQRITQRLILAPRGEVDLAAQDMRSRRIGAGVYKIEAGVRLRYEFAREFAPYVGIAQEWRTGRSAGFARADGDNPSTTSLVAGIRFWF